MARGALKLDDGAVEAVTIRRASLLPAGITGVDGTFEAGDPVDLTDETGKPVARGLVNYDAKELPSLMGRSTRWLVVQAGPRIRTRGSPPRRPGNPLDQQQSHGEREQAGRRRETSHAPLHHA